MADGAGGRGGRLRPIIGIDALLIITVGDGLLGGHNYHARPIRGEDNGWSC